MLRRLTQVMVNCSSAPRPGTNIQDIVYDEVLDRPFAEKVGAQHALYCRFSLKPSHFRSGDIHPLDLWNR